MKLHKNRIVTFLNFHGFYKNEIKKLLLFTNESAMQCFGG